MLFTTFARLTSTYPRLVRLFAVALLLGVPGSRAMAAATVPWHAGLAEAQRASQISGRPTLAIFTASWMATAAAIDRTALASDEAVALVTACYEPVCVDVDANPEATRRAGVSRVPTACVLTPDGQVLSKFELPETPAEFVAAAARAAQDAAFATATAQSLPRGVTIDQSRIPHLSGSGSAFGGSEGCETRPAASGQPRGLVPPGGRAITAVAAKVRMLSDFASTDCPATASGDAIAAETAVSGSAQQSASPTPIMVASSSSTPTANVATAAAPMEALAGSTAEAPLGIDASTSAPASASPGGAAPWLGLPQSAPAIAPPAPQPASAAVAATPAPATKVIEPQPSAPEKVAEPTSGVADATSPAPAAAGTSSLLATLQKPFSMFTRSTPPRTEPKPQAATSSTTSSSAAPASPAEPDQYGSMPVGLEGYCPVMLAERGVWVEGRAQWGARHRGRTYLFAGEQQQKAFLADPDRYAPALSGDDPVLAFDSGKSTPGQRRYGVTYQSRMYLFSTAETRDAFAANPQRYTAGTFVAENRGPAVAAGGSVVR